MANANVQTSGVPPLGEGVAPVGGFPGDGSPVTTRAGGWSSGPGAITWHGGQWIVPYTAHPGSSIANVSCDVLANATSTDLVELVSSNGQVLGSTVVPAVSGVVIRAWIVLASGHTVIEGEQLIMRHNPRSVGSGAWTGPAEDHVIISCAVNTSKVHTITVPIVASISAPSLTANLLSITGSGFGGSHVAVPLPLAVGQTLSAVRVRVADSVGLSTGATVSRFAEALLRQDDSNENFTTVATASPSLGNNTEQTVAISPLSVQVASGSQYWVALQNASGTGQSLVYRLEIDVQ